MGNNVIEINQKKNMDPKLRFLENIRLKRIEN